MFNRNHPGRRRVRIFFPVAFTILFFVVSAVVMLLWNALLPDIVHVTAITYWQSAGILMLCRILFGGMPFGKGGRGRFGRGPSPEMREKLMSMSEEERAKFKEQWKERCRDMRGRR
jgi:hypothetical protein